MMVEPSRPSNHPHPVQSIHWFRAAPGPASTSIMLDSLLHTCPVPLKHGREQKCYMYFLSWSSSGSHFPLSVFIHGRVPLLCLFHVLGALKHLWRKIWKWMLFQIAHRLPAIEKNRWRARWEIYLLHARARAFGKVQQFGHPGALSDANARIIQRTSACTGGRVLGMEMWRDIWSRFIMGKGGGEWVIREGHCLSLILKCHLHEMSPFSIFALQIWNLCYASVAVAIYNAFAVKWVRSKLGRAFICRSII